jgi:hypothetical protein
VWCMKKIISTLELGRGLGWFATVPVPFFLPGLV